MRWLRKERDFIGLVMVWGLLLQSLVIPFSTTAHAAMLATGFESASIICTTRTASQIAPGTFSPDGQKQSRSSADCQCCHMSCRQGCGGTCGGFLPSFASVTWPRSVPVAATRQPGAPQSAALARLTQAGPRSPPAS